MRKIIKPLLFILLLSMFVLIGNTTEVTANVSNELDYIGKVQLGGETIGLQVKTNVEVVGTYEIKTKDEVYKPWSNSDIKEGDIIYSVDDKLIYSNDDLNEVIKNSENVQLRLKLIRDDKFIDTTINVVDNNSGRKSIGLYIRDHITGVGTLTFVNTETNKYGALGHDVNDALQSGNIFDSSIKGVKKATKGIPGEKYATLSSNSIGTIESNLNIGVFGDYHKKLNNDIVNIIKAEDVKIGKAQIVTVINGNMKRYYDIEIIEVLKQKQDDIKGIKIKVTDPDLIETTGGIIQGMSGSPIIQDGNLVGAVSHVIVNDPLYGYAVFAEWMYNKTI